MPQVNKVSTLKGHTERATDVAFSPTGDQLATASADRTARLWNKEGSLLKTYEGHLDRLARIAFHPSGKYLGTASFDKTWRLWDVETGEELLLQEGHSRSVYGIAFQNDGSLAASCGLDALVRVWDLRSGRSILALEGHVKPVRLLFLDFIGLSPFCILNAALKRIVGVQAHLKQFFLFCFRFLVSVFLPMAIIWLLVVKIILAEFGI